MSEIAVKDIVEALPYIRKHSGKNIVIKYGGSAMIEPKLSNNFSENIKILVDYLILSYTV